MARRRVNGPYRHGARWRIIIVGTDGSQSPASYETEREAEDEKAKLERQFAREQGVTVTDALAAYEVHQRGAGNEPVSIATTRYRVKRLLAEHLDRALPMISESQAAKAYEELTQKVSVDYHRNALNETKTFMRWCAAKPRCWIKRDPFANVDGIGKRKRGKPQLHLDESQKYIETCKQVADRGDIAGIVGLGALYFGTRITELVSRPVRDLDDDGWLLWIPRSKTENGKRTLEVPGDLRHYLLQLAAGKGSEEPLFRGPRKGKTITRYTAHGMVKRMCRLAGVPEVSPHGLRGTHGTLAREHGSTPLVVAAALGHGSYDAVTAKNYVAPGTDERLRQRAALRVMKGGRR